VLNSTPPFQLATETPNTDQATAQFTALLPTTKNLLFTDRRIVYTDGSKTENDLSGGIFDTHTNAAIHITITGHSSILHTPFRAETATILHALRTTDPTPDITIATDSQSGLQNISSILLYPHKFRIHKHRNLLHQIINALLCRDGTTTIIKVKAHSGISGNEQADAAATNLNSELPTSAFDEKHNFKPGRSPTFSKIPQTNDPISHDMALLPQYNFWIPAGDPKTSTHPLIRRLSLHQRKSTK
jgi:ribonuclease HI